MISVNKAKGINMSAEKKQFEHVIRERWCKGCNICVAFCPKGVLSLSKGKVFAEKPEECIGCKLCEMRCPDFAIEVQEKNKKEVSSPDASKMDFSIPPEEQ
jgi:2-oxoglutarate ferredoxin oxidoreductase subunit delta